MIFSGTNVAFIQWDFYLVKNVVVGQCYHFILIRHKYAENTDSKFREEKILLYLKENGNDDKMF